LSSSVSAAEVIHGYEVERIGQVRGVPFTSSVMASVRDLDEFREAVRVRKKIEACFAAFVFNASPEDGGVGIPGTDPATGERRETFEPGMIEYCNGAKDVRFADPKSNGGEDAYIRSELRAQSTGVEIPYAILSDDWSQSNYSSSRMGMVNLQDSVEIFREFALITPMLKPQTKAIIDAAYMQGLIREPDYDLEWGTPEFNLLDRETESAADNLQVLNGSLSWGQMCARYGWDPEQQAEEIRYWQQRLAQMGITVQFSATAMQTLREKDAGIAQGNPQ
jgi:capsid protein